MRHRVWAGMHDLAALAGTGPSYRQTRRFGDVTVSDMAVPHPWGLNAVVGPGLPADADLDDAVAWLRAHDQGPGWRVSVPPDLQDAVAVLGHLAVVDSLPLYAMPAASAAAWPSPTARGVTIVRSDDVDEVRAAYGGWMDDRPLADLLVSIEDVRHPRRAFLVARADGLPVGCALVWWVAGTGYLSGIGVLPAHRRRGIGRALTTEAARVAAAEAPHGTTPDVIWMGATADGAALYTRMGFTHIDDEVRLGPR